MGTCGLVEQNCVEGALPPCSCACPANLKVRDFTRKMRNGNFNGAYRTLQDGLVFPEIAVSVCDHGCSGSCKEDIDIPALERACLAHATSRKPNVYNIPRKDKRIAVVGAGFAGLVCARRFGSERWGVTLFERQGDVGGDLRSTMPLDVLFECLDREFQAAPHERLLGHEVGSLDELDGFDAIIVATGADGEDFGLMDGWNPQSMSTTCPGVFLCGQRTGATQMEALSQAVIACASVERYLKISSMSGEPETFRQTKSRLPLFKATGTLPVVPSNGSTYSKAEARDEAARCTQCDCNICRDGCEMLKSMNLSARKVEQDVRLSAGTAQGLFDRVGSRMIYSCDLCGHCGSICPQGISLDGILEDGKTTLFADGHFAPALHDFYLRDMADAMGPDFLLRGPEDGHQPRFLLLPGCQTTASSPEYVLKSLEWMQVSFGEDECAVMLACCGVPALRAGDKPLLKQTLDKLHEGWEQLGRPTLVLHCASCARTFERFLPDVPFTSLYELMAQSEEQRSEESRLPHAAPGVLGEWSVFDPCASRQFPTMQKAVRTLAEYQGAVLSELPEDGSTARCCGMGGHVYTANNAVAERTLNRAMGLSENPYVCSCVNCRNQFLGGGKKCVHVLDLVFGLEPLREAPGVSHKSRNRRWLRNQLLASGGAAASCDNTAEAEEWDPRFEIPREVRLKMDQLFLSDEEVLSVVQHSLDSGSGVLSSKTGICSDHLRVGMITLWVQYRMQGNKVVLVNVYCHRIEIMEDDAAVGV